MLMQPQHSHEVMERMLPHLVETSMTALPLQDALHPVGMAVSTLEKWTGSCTDFLQLQSITGDQEVWLKSTIYLFPPNCLIQTCRQTGEKESNDGWTTQKVSRQDG